jgi:hypothetical protein
MLDFPDLGSQAEASQNRPRGSECPWNKLIYSETRKRSIYFLSRTSSSISVSKMLMKGQLGCPFLAFFARIGPLFPTCRLQFPAS